MALQNQFDPASAQGNTAGNMPMQGMPQAMPGATPDGGPAAAGAQPDPSMGSYGADQDTPDDEKYENMIDYALTQANLAKTLRKTKKGKQTLEDMGPEIVKGYEEDEESRKEWMRRNDEWLKMAMLVRENKTWPWPKASNIKYPLLATAAMQFSARAYPALVPSDGHIVKSKIVQMQPTDQIWQAAENVMRHMSWQFLEKIPNWEEDMDKLLMTMAISGICFKKTYYDNIANCIHSHIVYPENLCVNYWAKNLSKAYRKTEILYYTDNDIAEKVNNDEFFLDLDFPAPTPEPSEIKKKVEVSGVTPPPPGKSTPHIFLSCHTYWDIDGDGYEEPVIITVHKATKQVVRVIARYTKDGIHRDEKGNTIRIDALEYFTDFPFIPNPDGSVYALGFGLLLGPLNESANTLVNLLVDAGVLNNMPAGFIGKGLRLRIGQTALQPGEYKVVNATGEDLQKSVWTLPVKEPSSTLFQLLNMLLQSGKELASIAEIFVGKMPGQNTPATTTQETVQQGMAVFTAIYKRVYRSLGKEFKKVFYLNKICPDVVEEESKILGIPLQASDYDLPEWTIIPGADPTGDSVTTKQAKLQQVGQLLQMGTIDPMVFTRMMLDANEIPNAQQLIKQPQPPQPDPKMQTEQAKQQTEQLKQQGIQAKQQGEEQMRQQELSIKEREMALKEREFELKQQHELMMSQIEAHGKRMEMHQKVVNDALKAFMGQQQHQQKMQHQQQVHQQGLAQGALSGTLKLKQQQQAGQQKLDQGQAAFDQQQAQAAETSDTTE